MPVDADPVIRAATTTLNRRIPRIPVNVRCAAFVGGLTAFVVCVWLSLAGHLGLAPVHFNGGFYDAQGRAWLDGRWDLPADVIGREGYPTTNGLQIYFGVLPVVARLPVLLLTDAFDGRLTQIVSIVPFIVALVCATRLLWSARVALVRRDPVASRSYAFATGVFVFALGAGSALTFVAVFPSVYHEAILWGTAMSVAAIDFQVRYALAPSRRLALGAGLFAAAALHSRVTAGAAVMLPVAAWAVTAMLVRIRDRVRPHRAAPDVVRRAADAWLPDRRVLATHMWLLLALVAIPVALYGTVNFVRFAHPWKVPYETQLVYQEPVRAARLERNGNNLFGLQYVPSSLIAYLRLDALSLGGPPPYVTFRDVRETYVGGVEYDFVDPTSSLPAAMPLLFGAAIVGGVAMVRRPRRRRTKAFRLPAMAALGAALAPFAYSLLSYRYLADVVPLLVVLGSVGVAALVTATEGNRAKRRAVGVGLFLLALWSTWVAVGLCTTFRRVMHPISASDLASWVTTVSDFEGERSGSPAIPVASQPGAPVLWGRMRRADCSRVYVAQGVYWAPIEARAGTGAYRLRVELPPADAAAIGKVVPLTTSADGQIVAGLVRTASGAVEARASEDGGQTWSSYSTLTSWPAAVPGEEGSVDVLVDYDWFTDQLTMFDLGPSGQLLMMRRLTGDEQQVHLSPAAGVTELPMSTPLCDRWFPS